MTPFILNILKDVNNASMYCFDDKVKEALIKNHLNEIFIRATAILEMLNNTDK